MKMHVCGRTKGLELSPPSLGSALVGSSVRYLGINNVIWVIAITKRSRELLFPGKGASRGSES